MHHRSCPSAATGGAYRTVGPLRRGTLTSSPSVTYRQYAILRMVLGSSGLRGDDGAARADRPIRGDAPGASPLRARWASLVPKTTADPAPDGRALRPGDLL